MTLDLLVIGGVSSTILVILNLINLLTNPVKKLMGRIDRLEKTVQKLEECEKTAEKQKTGINALTRGMLGLIEHMQIADPQSPALIKAKDNINDFLISNQ